MMRKLMSKDIKHNAFKYVEPNAPTESGLYWPEQNGVTGDIWEYSYYLGSVEIDGRKLDLGVYVGPFEDERTWGEPDMEREYGYQEVYDATCYGPDGGDYISGPMFPPFCLTGSVLPVKKDDLQAHKELCFHRLRHFGLPYHENRDAWANLKTTADSIARYSKADELHRKMYPRKEDKS